MTDCNRSSVATLVSAYSFFCIHIIILLETHSVFCQEEEFIYYIELLRASLNIQNSGTFSKSFEFFIVINRQNILPDFDQNCIKCIIGQDV